MLKFLAFALFALLLYGCSSQKEITKSNEQDYFLNKSTPIDSSRIALNEFIDGSVAEAKGDYDTAIKYYNHVLKLKPEAGVYFALAKSYFYQNKLSFALPCARMAVKLDSSRIDYYNLLSDIYSEAKQFDSSAVVLSKIIQLDSTDINAYYQLARIYENNKPSKAIEIYNQITSFIGPDWNVLMRVADLESKLGNFKAAAGSIQKLITIDPNNPGLKKLLAEYYLHAKMYKEALKAIDDVLLTNPDDIDAHQRKAQIYLAQNNWDAASKEFSYILNRSDIPLDAKIRIGASYFEQSFKDSTLLPIAKKFFTEINKDTTDWQVKMYLGAIAIDEKDDSAAIGYFKSATQLASWNVEGWVRLGGLYFDNKKYNEAALVMQQAVKSFPEDFRVNLILGLALAQNNKNQEALPYLKKAVDLNSNDPTALSAYGFTLSQLKQNDEAIVYISKALKISPDDVNLLGTLGLIYDNKKEWKECDSIYQRALNIDSLNALINNNYAYSLSERGIDLDRALKMAKIAITKEPENSSYLDTIGWVYYKMKDYKLAKEYAEKAVKIDGSKSDLWEHLGDIEYKMGEKEKAIATWKKALELNKDNAALKQKIEKGES